MKKYQVEYTATVHGRKDIEANSKEEAEVNLWHFLNEHGLPPLVASCSTFLVQHSEELEYD